MAGERRARWDLLALAASLVTVLTGAGYVWLIEQQGNSPVAWFLGGLAISAFLAVYGAMPAVPLRTGTLAISGGILAVLGGLGLASIGLPLIGAAALALASGARSYLHTHARPSRHREPDRHGGAGGFGR
jgi:hypothetical protein